MKFNILISLVIKLILIYPGIVNNLECSREYPLFDLETNNCTFEVFNKTKHIISNKIILNQWLNKINQIGISNTRYASIEFSSKKDLIIQSFIYSPYIFLYKDIFMELHLMGDHYFMRKKMINLLTKKRLIQIQIFRNVNIN